MSKVSIKRPLLLSCGTEIKIGMKLYSLGQKQFCYSYNNPKENEVRMWSGNTLSKIEEYEVIHVDERENARSFKVKSSHNCEERYSLKGCDIYLQRMDFKTSPEKIIPLAKKKELEHVDKINKSISKIEKDLKDEGRRVSEGIKKRKDALRKLKKNISRMQSTLKVCKSC